MSNANPHSRGSGRDSSGKYNIRTGYKSGSNRRRHNKKWISRKGTR